ncbi:MAG: DNA gyrase inhibitor YacG [Planctomycetota bacterium]|nr:DNA gyrase inhibitor YacG [Planctomycetota bacterium]
MKRPTCPTCEKPVDMGSNRYRPFCCERCQLIDLGRWFGEGYSIPLEGEEDREPGELQDCEEDGPASEES